MMPAADENGDIRARVNAIEHTVASLNNQITLLDQWRQQVQISEARTDEKWKNVDKRFDDLDKKIGNVNGTLQKIMWLFVSAFVSATVVAVVAFVINGGLRVP